MADMPESRLRDLQIGNPVKLRLVASVQFKSRKMALRIEKGLHRLFRRHRIHGEWFDKKIPLKKADAYISRGHIRGNFADSVVDDFETRAIERIELEILKEARARI